MTSAPARYTENMSAFVRTRGRLAASEFVPFGVILWSGQRAGRLSDGLCHFGGIALACSHVNVYRHPPILFPNDDLL
jgi:hypothetical protein